MPHGLRITTSDYIIWTPRYLVPVAKSTKKHCQFYMVQTPSSSIDFRTSTFDRPWPDSLPDSIPRELTYPMPRQYSSNTRPLSLFDVGMYLLLRSKVSIIMHHYAEVLACVKEYCQAFSKYLPSIPLSGHYVYWLLILIARDMPYHFKICLRALQRQEKCADSQKQREQIVRQLDLLLESYWPFTTFTDLFRRVEMTWILSISRFVKRERNYSITMGYRMSEAIFFRMCLTKTANSLEYLPPSLWPLFESLNFGFPQSLIGSVASWLHGRISLSCT